MDTNTVTNWILAGNSAAMDWYAMTHDKPLPSQSALQRLIGADLGPVTVQPGLIPVSGGFSTGPILVALLIGAAVFFVVRR